MAQKKLDTYLNLCTQVYNLSKPTPPEDEYTFYRSYVAKAKDLILEPMCGTGRFLLPLLEEGFDIHGFDASEHMLESLSIKAKSKNLTPHIWKNFAESFESPNHYALIFIPTGSFGLIIETGAVKAALKNFYNHLTDDGILLIEGEILEAIPPLCVWQGSKWSRPDGKMIMLSQYSTLEGTICSSLCKYELVADQIIIQTEIEDLRVRHYSPEELSALLKEAGFTQIRLIKAFDQASEPGELDESIVYECRK